MKIHAFARWPFLMDHLAPIHEHLPAGLRGEALTIQNPATAHVKHWGRDDIVMVAGYPDIAIAGTRRVIYVEHGAGQRYSGAIGESSRYYHGGEHPTNVVGYIGPRQDVIDAWGRPGYATGAPACDPYELFSPERVAAITFHWNGAIPWKVGVPEAGTAFEHYRPHMEAIVTALRFNGWEILGHRHPRFNHMRGYWERKHNVREASVDEIRRRAQLLIADNTSLMYEMLYCGRDVIALNCPEYRRDVEHGLRFWQWAPAVQADDHTELIDRIDSYDETRARSASLCDWEITKYVYGKAHSDGSDGLRAAAWVTQFVSTL